MYKYRVDFHLNGLLVYAEVTADDELSARAHILLNYPRAQGLDAKCLTQVIPYAKPRVLEMNQGEVIRVDFKARKRVA